MEEKRKSDQQTASEAYELAGLVERLLAHLIDSFLLFIPLMIAILIIMQPGNNPPIQLIQFVAFAVPVAYYWYFWTRRAGQTPGKFALGIRVIKADGTTITDIDALIRAIGYSVSSMLFGLGFIWALLDRKNQTWHDKMARTLVVRNSNQRKTIDIPA